ncbi:replication protein [Evansella cellulosilytica]|uniref:Bacteriophage lambda Replication protein O N-terminal domain-containing protein n=1 Tax=Evansella cellulosilytica (strain ATCC 21833 / DSM 2522 / FERM P-1141 / JCM 9156 / N-4) TaxID=649639 RepID=E6TVI1_EVAC2|nr:replication protein [Evansella cellulosilytica]ADU30998.1 hypothetical protein Bcell_2743 [Evansella cellulosilytica DSM 2522]
MRKYTEIPNEVLDKLLITKVNGTQRKIIDCVMRHTYGVERSYNEMSDSFIASEILTDRHHVNVELNRLINRNIITVVHAPIGKTRTICVNKNVHEWKQPK